MNYEVGFTAQKEVVEYVRQVDLNTQELVAQIDTLAALFDAIDADPKQKAVVQAMLNHVYLDYKYADLRASVNKSQTLKDWLVAHGYVT